MSGFFAELDELVATSTITIDRPAGSAHPRFPTVVYPVDYGYLDETSSGDGEGVDAFVGTASGTGVVAVLCTVDRNKRDVETKLLVDCAAAEVAAVEDMLTHGLRLGTQLMARPDQQGDRQ